MLVASKGCGEVAEIELSCGAVEHRDAVEHDAAREGRCEDVLGCCLCRLLLVLVESHEACHRHACHLESEEEHKEVAAGYHYEHAEQGGDEEHVELALVLHVYGTRLHPRLCHEHHDECACGKNDFHDIGCCRGDIHAAKGLGGLCDDAYCRHYCQEAESETREGVALHLHVGDDEIDNEHEYQGENQEGLRNHI